MTEPTKGPWHSVGRGVFAGAVHIATTTHPADLETNPDGAFPTYDVSIANASLIASAPEMLDTLKSIMVAWNEKALSDVMFFPIRQARAMVVKLDPKWAP